jgi:hypothetical protein
VVAARAAAERVVVTATEVGAGGVETVEERGRLAAAVDTGTVVTPAEPVPVPVPVPVPWAVHAVKIRNGVTTVLRRALIPRR